MLLTDLQSLGLKLRGSKLLDDLKKSGSFFITSRSSKELEGSKAKRHSVLGTGLFIRPVLALRIARGKREWWNSDWVDWIVVSPAECGAPDGVPDGIDGAACRAEYELEQNVPPRDPDSLISER